MSIWIQLPTHFNFDDLVSEARAGRLNPEAFAQSVALDMSRTQFVGIGAAACLKALALRYQDGWPQGECLAMRHGGQDEPRSVQKANSYQFRLVDGDHEIDCKVDGLAIGLKACFVKKA